MSKELYDAMIRHQIYVEGVKAGEYLNFQEVNSGIKRSVTAIFNKVSVETMDGLKRSALNKIINSSVSAYTAAMKKYGAAMWKRFREFVTANKYVLDYIINLAVKKRKFYGPVADEVVIDQLPASEVPPEDDNLLWLFLLKLPLEASGMTPRDNFSGLANAGRVMLETTIRKGWAAKAKVKDVLTAIVGSGKVVADGILEKIVRQTEAATGSIIQHISSVVKDALAMRQVGKYMWVSIIDNVTTQICRLRNRNIYEYGRGPIPPAHYRCRSTTVPVVDSFVPDATFGQWIKRQPPKFAQDILTDARGIKFLRPGEYRVPDYLETFNGPRNALTIEEFRAKRALMITGLFGNNP